MDNITYKYKKETNTLEMHGTNEALDLRTTLNRIHNMSGFHTGCYNAAKFIHRDILKKIDPHKKLIIEGHSMGGAIAQCLAHLLKMNKIDSYLDLKGSYPSCPSWFFCEGKMVVYGNDPVPSLFKKKYHFPVKVEHIGPNRSKLKTFFQWFRLRKGDHMGYFK
jgi:hypothetical protein